MRSGIDFIATYRVRPDRVRDFEDWMGTVAAPAADDRPALADHWEILRVEEPDDDGSIVYVGLFRGGSITDWDLEPLLEQQHGKERAESEIRTLLGMLAEERPWREWSVRPLSLGDGNAAEPE